MKLLITGASGFLGRYVVAEALRRGHQVRAVLRTADLSSFDWTPAGNVEPVKVDLRSRRGLVDALQGVDAVLHLAAAKAGDMYAQYAGTVVATENLLWAMDQAGVKQIVGISSLSVYDYLKMSGGELLTEESPLEETAFDRDEYAHTKLIQERLIREHATKNGWAYTILRPGVIYGKDNLWTARLGQKAGKIWIRIGGKGILPLTYVENCAEAIVMSAESPAANGQTLNVIDDDSPRQRDYVQELRSRERHKPRVLPVAWPVMRLLAAVASGTNRFIFRGKAKVPGLFVPARAHARFKPLRFTNDKIKQVLGWKPRYSLNDAIERITLAEMGEQGMGLGYSNAFSGRT